VMRATDRLNHSRASHVENKNLIERGENLLLKCEFQSSLDIV